MPNYLGAVGEVDLITEGGKRFATIAGQLKEVIVANQADLAAIGSHAKEGVYEVGTGNTGATKVRNLSFILKFKFSLPLERLF